MITGDKFIKFTGKSHNGNNEYAEATVLFNATEKIRKITLYEHILEYSDDKFAIEKEFKTYELEVQTLLIISHFQYPTKAERDADYHRFLKTFNFEVQESEEKCKP